MNTLPEHSPLGASSAERWMNCPGSVTLIELLHQSPDWMADHIDDPDWRADGVQAHEVAALCLNSGQDVWEVSDPKKYGRLTADMMAAVQTYLDYVRGLKGWKFVELKMHRPEFHGLMFGTTDAACLDPDALEIVDYKHGVGIVVEVEENPQIMYYAFMVIDELGSAWDDETPIKLTICQPRVPWREPIRSWVSTVGYIRTWARDVLHPSMQRVYTDSYLSPGEHCRFCPAKLLCPGFLTTAKNGAALTLDILQELNEPLLAELLEKQPILLMASKALKEEAKRRVINKHRLIPGWKIVRARANRVWKSPAMEALKAKFGTEMWRPVEVKSPPQIEEMPGGKAFVAEWAYTPESGFDIVPATDRRKEIVIEGPEKWKSFVDNLAKQD
jgi:uncharacterized protein DUF2800